MVRVVVAEVCRYVQAGEGEGVEQFAGVELQDWAGDWIAVRVLQSFGWGVGGVVVVVDVVIVVVVKVGLAAFE